MLILWVVVAVRTLYLAYTGEIFFAPCLKDLRVKDRQTEIPKTESEKV